MPTMDAVTSLATAEQALRDLVTAVMYKEHGADWMDKVVEPAHRQQWKKIHEQEAKRRVGHTLSGVDDLSYAFLGELIGIIQKTGHWEQFFEPVLGPRDEVFALLNILQTIRRPVSHSRPLLPFEEDLISGIAGRIRNQVTIYLSDQDPDGDYYSRIERIEDSLGNAFTYIQGTDFSDVLSLHTPTALRVGDIVTFRCEGTDPHGRKLTWRLEHAPPGEPVESQGDHVDLVWRVQPTDTGKKWVAVHLRHEGHYHRHVGEDLLADATVRFYYRVLPPS